MTGVSQLLLPQIEKAKSWNWNPLLTWKIPSLACLTPGAGGGGGAVLNAWLRYLTTIAV